MSKEPLAPPVPSGDTIQGWLCQCVDKCGLSPGMVVGVTRDGRRTVLAHGAADTAGRMVNKDTVFEIGSITKLFTALLLARHGTVRRDCAG